MSRIPLSGVKALIMIFNCWFQLSSLCVPFLIAVLLRYLWTNFFKFRGLEKLAFLQEDDGNKMDSLRAPGGRKLRMAIFFLSLRVPAERNKNRDKLSLFPYASCQSKIFFLLILCKPFTDSQFFFYRYLFLLLCFTSCKLNSFARPWPVGRSQLEGLVWM